MTATASYGFDAPDVTRNSLLGGAAVFLLGAVAIGRWGVAGAIPMLAGFVVALPGFSLLAYVRWGKFRMRDRMLGLVPWRGDEAVLDVGTGRGLLLIGAARRLTTGRATGIDIWRAEDLSGNTRAATLCNAAIEGVEHRIDVQDGDIRKTTFPDACFDVVLSQLCLHNIADKGERLAACREIVRVLKPGGRVVVGDYIPTGAYAKAFAEAGLVIHGSRPHFADAIGPMWIVHASKPGG